MSSSSSSSTSTSTSSVSIANSTSTTANAQQKEAWPSLSVSPVNSKETLASACSNGKSKKEKLRNEKTRHEKNKSKSKQNAYPTSNATSNKENFIPESKGNTSASATATVLNDDTVAASTKTDENVVSNRSKTERNKERVTLNRSNAAKDQRETKETNQTQSNKQLDHSEDSLNTNKDKDTDTDTSKGSENSKLFSLPKRSSPNVHRSHSSSSENSDDPISESSVSGKSSPGNFKETESNASSNAEGQTEIPINNNHNNREFENGVFVNTDDVNTDSIQKTCDSESRTKDELDWISQQETELLNPAENDCEKEVTGKNCFTVTFRHNKL